MLPRFEVVARRRPVDLVVPGSSLPPVAPYAAVQGVIHGPGPAGLTLRSGHVVLTAWYHHDRVVLAVTTGSRTTGSRTTEHRSRRFGRPTGAVDGLALILTGPQVTALSREGVTWVARARFDVTERFDPHDEQWLGGLVASSEGPVGSVQAGAFGQVGLRDLRMVSNADGTPYRSPDDPHNDTVLLTASSSGPGPFPTSHTSVWALDPATYVLRHRADLFFRRPDRPGVFGDHATHLVRDGDRWLVATSTWGSFDRSRPDSTVGVTLAETDADLLSGRHVLDTRPLLLPTVGLRSVGVWDPHLVRPSGSTDWLVGYVSATKFFRFHPVVATGPDLDTLTLRAAAADRRATEGTTLVRLDDDWKVLASDGRDGRRGQRAAYPLFDLDLRQVGTVEAAYPTNLPWPTLVPIGADWLMVGFNGEQYGGRLVGHGSHGTVVIQLGRSTV